MYNFSIGDIIVHNHPNRENTFWVIVGYGIEYKLKRTEYSYKIVPVQRLDEINYPFESEVEHTHKHYHKVT